MKRMVILVALLVLSFAANASDDPSPVVRRVKLPPPEQGAIDLPAPPTWQVKAERPLAFVAPTVSFIPPEGDAFSVLITILRNVNDDPDFTHAKTLSKAVAKKRDLAVEFATTRHIPILEFQGDQLFGYYFTATDREFTETDREPKPGEWIYMTSGFAALGDLQLSFTIFSNDPDQPEAASTLAMLQNARRVDQ